MNELDGLGYIEVCGGGGRRREGKFVFGRENGESFL